MSDSWFYPTGVETVADVAVVGAVLPVFVPVGAKRLAATSTGEAVGGETEQLFRMVVPPGESASTATKPLTSFDRPDEHTTVSTFEIGLPRWASLSSTTQRFHRITGDAELNGNLPITTPTGTHPKNPLF